MIKIREITPLTTGCPNRISTERCLIDEIHRVLDDGVPEKKIIELGCGPGEFRFLFPNVLSYLGVDCCDFDFTRKSSSNISFLVERVENLELPESFDLLFSHYSFHYFVQTKELFDKCFDLLSPGGVMVISIPRRMVLLYEWPNVILGMFGRRMWVSASGEAKRYFDKRFVRNLRMSGFEDVKVKCGAGPITGGIKFIFILVSSIYLLFLMAKYGLIRITKGRKAAQKYREQIAEGFSFLPKREIGKAIDYKSFLEVWYAKSSRREWFVAFYDLLLALARMIDQVIPTCFAFEVVVTSKKPLEIKDL